MKIKEIRIDQLDFTDERFRTSYFFSIDRFIRSIEDIGLINPPVVTERNGRLLIVAGWKRMLTCKKMSLSRVPALLLEEDNDLKAFRISILENVTVRNFSLLEKAEIIRRLIDFGESEKTIIKTYFPLLAVPQAHDYLRFFMEVSRLDPEEKGSIHKNNVSLVALQRLVEFARDERKALLPLLFPLGQNKQKELLEVIHELCLKGGLTVGQILEEEEFKTVLQSKHLTPLQISDKIRLLLKKKRFPLLSARQDAFVAAKRKMAWPRDIKISPTPFFEDEKLFVEFSFQSKKEYLDRLDSLRAAASLEEFIKLFGTHEDD